jgi:hypothetical protein
LEFANITINLSCEILEENNDGTNNLLSDIKKIVKKTFIEENLTFQDYKLGNVGFNVDVDYVED